MPLQTVGFPRLACTGALRGAANRGLSGGQAVGCRGRHSETRRLLRSSCQQSAVALRSSRLHAVPPTAGAEQAPLPTPPPAAASFSVWVTKPPWCQPWTILLTGGGAVAASWQLFHTPWLTVPVSAAVLGWWGLFLVLYPAQVAQFVRDCEDRGIDWRQELYRDD